MTPRWGVRAAPARARRRDQVLPPQPKEDIPFWGDSLMSSLLPQNGKKRFVCHLSTGVMKMILEAYMKGEVAQDHAALHAIAELFDVSIDYLPGFSEAEKFTFIFT